MEKCKVCNGTGIESQGDCRFCTPTNESFDLDKWFENDGIKEDMGVLDMIDEAVQACKEFYEGKIKKIKDSLEWYKDELEKHQLSILTIGDDCIKKNEENAKLKELLVNSIPYIVYAKTTAGNNLIKQIQESLEC